MRYYLDTEFHEDGKTIDLISIGVVCEDGREMYLVNREAELHRVNSWVREHVLPQLPSYGDPAWASRERIREELFVFIRPEVSLVEKNPKPEIWGYFADYDWVVVAQLFGTMMALPPHFPKCCLDLKQLALSLGNPRLPKQMRGKHNALEDARWNRDAHNFLLP